MKYALEEFMPQMDSPLGFAALQDLIPSMAQWPVLRDACCSSWTLDESPCVHAEPAASLARDTEEEILHVWAVSAAPDSLCSATHKTSFDLFYPLLQAWDFPGELQHWVCLSEGAVPLQH